MTNLETDSQAVVRLYNKRGPAEQWINEGKQAVKMTRLSVMAYNLGNLWRGVDGGCGFSEIRRATTTPCGGEAG